MAINREDQKQFKKLGLDVNKKYTPRVFNKEMLGEAGAPLHKGGNLSVSAKLPNSGDSPRKGVDIEKLRSIIAADRGSIVDPGVQAPEPEIPNEQLRKENPGSLTGFGKSVARGVFQAASSPLEMRDASIGNIGRIIDKTRPQNVKDALDQKAFGDVSYKDVVDFVRPGGNVQFGLKQADKIINSDFLKRNPRADVGIKKGYNDLVWWSESIGEALPSLAISMGMGWLGAGKEVAKKGAQTLTRGMAKKLGQTGMKGYANKLLETVKNPVFISSSVMEGGGQHAAFRSFMEANGQTMDEATTTQLWQDSAGTALNALISGKLETAGIEKLSKPLFKKLAGEGADEVAEKFWKRFTKEAIKEVPQGIITEGSTEGLQQLASNILTKMGYDPTQNILEGVLDSLAIGGAMGGGVNTVTSAVTGKKPGEETPTEDTLIEDTVAPPPAGTDETGNIDDELERQAELEDVAPLTEEEQAAEIRKEEVVNDLLDDGKPLTVESLQEIANDPEAMDLLNLTQEVIDEAIEEYEAIQADDEIATIVEEEKEIVKEEREVGAVEQEFLDKATELLDTKDGSLASLGAELADGTLDDKLAGRIAGELRTNFKDQADEFLKGYNDRAEEIKQEALRKKDLETGEPEVIEDLSLEPQVYVDNLQKVLNKKSDKGRIGKVKVSVADPSPTDKMYDYIAGLFGRKFIRVNVEGEDGYVPFQGVTINDMPGVVFGRKGDGVRPMLAILGHELNHSFKTEGSTAYQEFYNIAIDLIDDAEFKKHKEKVEQFFIDSRRAYRGDDGVLMNAKTDKPWTFTPDDVIMEELVSDFVGGEFTKPEFWAKLNDRNPTMFKRVVNMVTKYVAKIKKQLGSNDIYKGEQTKKIFSDLQAMEEAFGKFAETEIAKRDDVTKESIKAEKTAKAEKEAAIAKKDAEVEAKKEAKKKGKPVDKKPEVGEAKTFGKRGDTVTIIGNKGATVEAKITQDLGENGVVAKTQTGKVIIFRADGTSVEGNYTLKGGTPLETTEAKEPAEKPTTPAKANKAKGKKAATQAKPVEKAKTPPKKPAGEANLKTQGALYKALEDAAKQGDRETFEALKKKYAKRLDNMNAQTVHLPRSEAILAENESETTAPKTVVYPEGDYVPVDRDIFGALIKPGATETIADIATNDGDIRVKVEVRKRGTKDFIIRVTDTTNNKELMGFSEEKIPTKIGAVNIAEAFVNHLDPKKRPAEVITDDDITAYIERKDLVLNSKASTRERIKRVIMLERDLIERGILDENGIDKTDIEDTINNNDWYAELKELVTPNTSEDLNNVKFDEDGHLEIYERALASTKHLVTTSTFKNAPKIIREFKKDPRFYRGTYEGAENRRPIRDDYFPKLTEKGKRATFAAKGINTAVNFGDRIQEITPKKGAKILYEGTPEFGKAVGFTKYDPTTGMENQVKNFPGYDRKEFVKTYTFTGKDLQKIAVRAKNKGYDAISFVDDVWGTIIFNKNAFTSKTIIVGGDIVTEDALVEEELSDVKFDEGDLPTEISNKYLGSYERPITDYRVITKSVKMSNFPMVVNNMGQAMKNVHNMMMNLIKEGVKAETSFAMVEVTGLVRGGDTIVMPTVERWNKYYDPFRNIWITKPTFEKGYKVSNTWKVPVKDYKKALIDNNKRLFTTETIKKSDFAQHQTLLNIDDDVKFEEGFKSKLTNNKRLMNLPKFALPSDHLKVLKNIIKKDSTLKDEFEFTYVREWLIEQGDRPIHRNEVLQAFMDNEVSFTTQSINDSYDPSNRFWKQTSENFATLSPDNIEMWVKGVIYGSPNVGVQTRTRDNLEFFEQAKNSSGLHEVEIEDIDLEWDAFIETVRREGKDWYTMKPEEMADRFFNSEIGRMFDKSYEDLAELDPRYKEDYGEMNLWSDTNGVNFHEYEYKNIVYDPPTGVIYIGLGFAHSVTSNVLAHYRYHVFSNTANEDTKILELGDYYKPNDPKKNFYGGKEGEIKDRGNRSLFITEAQSDWHAQGANSLMGYEGDSYKPINRNILEVKSEAIPIGTRPYIEEEFQVQYGIYKDDQIVYEYTDPVIHSVGDKNTKLTDDQVFDRVDYQRKITFNLTKGVPKAPYKDTWPLLVFKNALKDAIKTGDIQQVVWPISKSDIAKIEDWPEDTINDPGRDTVVKHYSKTMVNLVNKFVKEYGSKVETVDGDRFAVVKISPELTDLVETGNLASFSEDFDGPVTRKSTSPKVKFVNKEFEKNAAKFKGVIKYTTVKGLAWRLKGIFNNFVSAHPALGEDDSIVKKLFVGVKDRGNLKSLLRLTKETFNYGTNEAWRRIYSTISGLDGNQRQLLSMNIILSDLYNDTIVNAGGNSTLNASTGFPFGFRSPGEIKAELDNMRKQAMKDPKVQAALAQRRKGMMELQKEMVIHGLLPKATLRDPDFFHRQVLEHKEEIGNLKFKSKSQTKDLLDYNTDYIEAEFQLLANYISAIEIKKYKNRINREFNIRAKVQREATKKGLPWRSMLNRDEYKDYTIWSPRHDSPFYFNKSLSERVMNKALMNNPDMTKKMLDTLMDRESNEWVIPKDVARALNQFEKNDVSQNFIAQFGRMTTNKWKKWTLLNPYRYAMYNFNNMVGDVDAVLAYDWRILEYAKESFKELLGDLDSLGVKILPFQKKVSAKLSQEKKDFLKMAHRLGIIGSGFIVHEIQDVNREFRAMVDPSHNIFAKGWQWAKDSTNFRENLLRLAAFKYFYNRIVVNGQTGIYAASKPDEIDAISDPTERAAKLTRELIGDYGNLSKSGEWMRSNIMPFYSWMEINSPRYLRMMANARREGKSELSALPVLTATWKTGKMVGAAAAMSIAVDMFNRTVFPDEERDLTDEQQRSLHLILGRYADGSVRYISFNGAFRDFLDWGDFDDIVSDIRDYRAGKKNIVDLSVEAFKAPINKIFHASHPFLSAGYQYITRSNMYPDIFNPRPMRDRTEHLFRLFSLNKLYNYVNGRPTYDGGISDALPGQLIKSADPGESAYFHINHLKFKFLKKEGKTFGGNASSNPKIKNKADGLYYYKRAMRMGDYKAAGKFLGQYFEHGGTQQGLNTSIKLSKPTGNIDQKLKKKFYSILDAEDKRKLDLASKWYRNVYSAENRQKARQALLESK